MATTYRISSSDAIELIDFAEVAVNNSVLAINYDKLGPGSNPFELVASVDYGDDLSGSTDWTITFSDIFEAFAWHNVAVNNGVVSINWSNFSNASDDAFDLVGELDYTNL